MKRILICDDDDTICEFLKEGLNGQYKVETVSRISDLFDRLQNRIYDCILLDVKLPDGNGIECLQKIRENSPETAVIMMTAYTSIDDAVKAIKEGAEDYLKKPFSIDEIELRLKNVLERRELKKENQLLKYLVKKEYCFSNMVGKTPEMQRIFEVIRIIANSKATVLIEGESGTGKELVARAIHYNSSRSSKPFVSINCASIPETLLESELFGYERGAFTGAVTQRKGKFELANGGTLLLDEISEMSYNLQAKLLRVLQEFEFYRIGGTTPVKVDVRVIATTNKDLQKLVKEGKFREDLYYRLNVIRIKLPPLRERKEDIPLLCEHFLKKYSKEYGKNIRGFAKGVIEKMMRYDFPGNVRELEHMIERAVIMCTGEYITEDLIVFDSDKFEDEREKKLDADRAIDVLVGKTIDEVEKMLILKTLEKTGWNKVKAAQILGVTDRTLRNKLALYRQTDTKLAKIR